MMHLARDLRLSFEDRDALRRLDEAGWHVTVSYLNDGFFLGVDYGAFALRAEGDWKRVARLLRLVGMQILDFWRESTDD